MSPHAYEQPYTGYDEYIAKLAAEQESLSEPPIEDEELAEILELSVPCELCGFRCSSKTWDGHLGPCPNCGNLRGRIPG